MSFLFYRIFVWSASILIGLDYVHSFYELPLKDSRYMILSNSVAVYNHTSYKDGEFRVSCNIGSTGVLFDESNSDKKKSDVTSKNEIFYMRFSYGSSKCLTINPQVKLDQDKLVNCSVKVTCNEKFDGSSFDSTSYKLLADGTLTKEKCDLKTQEKKIQNKAVFILNNSDEGSHLLSIQLMPPIDDSERTTKNYTIEMLVELESKHGYLTMVDYSVYKFHVCLCCFYFIIVLTGAVYFVYLRRNTNKLHSILGVSLLAGLLASFFYISAYESLNRNVSSVGEMKNVMVFAAILSSARRIAIDVTVLLVAVGYTILPIQNLSIKRPLLIFACYAVLFTSLTIYTHVSTSSSRLSLYTIFLLNNIFTSVIYSFCFVYLRNTASHSCQRRSPQMEYIGIFYRRFGYVVVLLTAILLFFSIPQMLELFKYNVCSKVYRMTLFEVFWILHSLICTIAVFLLIVLHPNAQTEIYGSLNFNYSQLPKDENESTNKFPLSSANIHIQRSNKEMDAFTLFDEKEENQDSSPNHNVVRFHKIQ